MKTYIMFDINGSILNKLSERFDMETDRWIDPLGEVEEKMREFQNKDGNFNIIDISTDLDKLESPFNICRLTSRDEYNIFRRLRGEDAI